MNRVVLVVGVAFAFCSGAMGIHFFPNGAWKGEITKRFADGSKIPVGVTLIIQENNLIYTIVEQGIEKRFKLRAEFDSSGTFAFSKDGEPVKGILGGCDQWRCQAAGINEAGEVAEDAWIFTQDGYLELTGTLREFGEIKEKWFGRLPPY